jgi:HTH-type transcriptional regulator / antitoxin HigA
MEKRLKCQVDDSGLGEGLPGLAIPQGRGIEYGRGFSMPSIHPDARQADRYLKLVSAFPLRPIRSDEELGQAIAVIDSLLDKDELHIDEQDYLEVLTRLVEDYEEQEVPFPPVSEADMLRHLIEARDITQIKLATETGIANSTISAILSGKRGLTRAQIATLSRYFTVSPAVFISS